MTITPTPEEQRDRLVFYPVAIMGGVFCVTVFMSIAALLGDQQVPAKQWINRHITTVLVVEAVLLLLTGILAMTIDRQRTLNGPGSKFPFARTP